MILDLDGVVYAGPHAVPGAPQALRALTDASIPYGFLTNNASRSSADIADSLVRMGLDAVPEQVVTSGMVAVRAIAEEIPAGARVLVIGSPALAGLVAEAGLEPVEDAADAPAAVVQGFDPSVGWKRIAEACVAVAAGTPWWATNPDITMPTERGLLPGNGAFVRIVAETTGARPRITGKPKAAAVRAAGAAVGGRRPIMVGDRLDTDIAGARSAGYASALVLTGIHDLHDALLAPARMRPDRIIGSLPDLLAEPPTPDLDVDGAARCGDAAVRLEDGVLRGAGPVLDVAAAALAVVGSLPEGSSFAVDESLPRRPDDGRS